MLHFLFFAFCLLVVLGSTIWILHFILDFIGWAMTNWRPHRTLTCILLLLGTEVAIILGSLLLL